jgi:hypothetical protein
LLAWYFAMARCVNFNCFISSSLATHGVILPPRQGKFQQLVSDTAAGVAIGGAVGHVVHEVVLAWLESMLIHQ